MRIKTRRIALVWGALAPAALACLFGQAGGLAEVYNLRQYAHPNFTRIVLDIGVLREYSFNETISPPQIYVDVLQARLNPILHEDVVPAGGGYIKAVRIAQKSPTTVRLTAEVDRARIRRYEVFHVSDPFRIVIDIYPQPDPKAKPEAKSPPPAKPAEPARSGYTMARQLGLGVRTIVLDPGHGGLDPGCLDPSGPKEKDLALDIALKLKALVQANTGLAVILTRETDIHVPLETRTVIANQRSADLFISIHINAFRSKSRRGIETFFLNFSPDPATNELAARENATTTKTIGGMEKILKKIVQNSKIVESQELARMIQANLVDYLGQRHPNVKNLGAKGGPFWTLLGSEMPSVLVEVGHLTNAEEGRRLQDPAYRQQVARGIYEGILAYLKSLGKG
jgi:N-acetylmuramoyl-L-alanine amidase